MTHMIILYLSFWLALILLIWFKSDAIIEWSWVLGLSKLICLDEFNKKKLESVIQGNPYSYPQFIKDKNDYNFLSKLIGCPICLSVWLSIIMCCLVSILTLSFFFLYIPFVCIISLLLYGSVSSLLKI